MLLIFQILLILLILNAKVDTSTVTGTIKSVTVKPVVQIEEMTKSELQELMTKILLEDV